MEHRGKAKGSTTSYQNLDSFTEGDQRCSAKLDEMMREIGLFESEEEAERRCVALQHLRLIVSKWIVKLFMEKGLDMEAAQEKGGTVVTFGSVRLQTVAPGGDIDTLLLAPKGITRDDFHSSFFEFLHHESRVTKLQSVEKAFVPLIKMEVDGIDIDLLFAALPYEGLSSHDTTKLTHELMLDSLLVKVVDDKTVRSLNGFRVAEMILQLVPNLQAFQTTLRFIKKWAENRGLHSNVMGYLGGVAWAILVAKICQVHPNMVPSQLIRQFFEFYSKWLWDNPVVLDTERFKQDELQSHGRERLAIREWRKAENKEHLMPIITPAFPVANSTHNVISSTRDVIQVELQRGYKFCQYLTRTDPLEDIEKFKLILEPLRITESAMHFLVVEMLARGEERFARWCAVVEHKIRKFVIDLQLKGLGVRPWPKKIAIQKANWEFGAALVLALHCNLKTTQIVDDHVDVRDAAAQFMIKIREDWKEESEKQFVQVSLSHYSQSQLPPYLKQTPSSSLNLPHTRPSESPRDLSQSPQPDKFNSVSPAPFTTHVGKRPIPPSESISNVTDSSSTAKQGQSEQPTTSSFQAPSYDSNQKMGGGGDVSQGYHHSVGYDHGGGGYVDESDRRKFRKAG
eukprot:GHVN01034097.1.p1 GENE.GHVN01034097.1~~GHVN01034097.1.p1  ORF type:complete len:625 (-),score=109.48 GHVN01034097.1:5932-7806(-)